MFTKSKQFQWKKVDFETASEKYSLSKYTNDSVETDDLFGEEPEHYLVHKGSVVVDGPIAFGADDEKDVTVHVIEGDLTVNGPLIVNQGDYYGVLLVTGSVKCDNALLAWDGQLLVGKSVDVKGLLVTYLTDAGHFVVQGGMSAGYWLEARPDGACIEFGKKPKAKMLRADEGDDDEGDEGESADDDDSKFGFSMSDATPASAVLAKGFFDDGEVDIEKIEAAMKKGKALLK